MNKEIFIIDAHAYLYRNYYALPKLTTPSGEEVGALYGFNRFLLKILKEKNPQFMVVCYDSPVKTFRYELFNEYKANRKKTDEALIRQIDLSKDLVKALGIKEITINGYEADDIIAAISYKLSLENYKVIIISHDKDLTQLIGDNIFIWDGISKEYFGREYVISKFGLLPEKMVDYLSLIGDTSDNVPGVKGIGPKMALKLIEKYGSIENIIDKINKGEIDKDLIKIKDNIELLKLSKKLVELNYNLPIEININNFIVSMPDKNKLKFFAEKFMFKELLNMVSENDFFSNSLPELKKENINIFIERAKDYINFEPEKNIIVFEEFYSEYNDNELKDILKRNIRKNFYNLKNFMHIKNLTFNLDNFNDIYIAYHLCHGGERKPELKRIIAENFGLTEESDNFLYSFYFEKIMLNLEKQLLEKGLKPLYNDIEIPLINVLYNMEKNGVKIDINKLKTLATEFERKIEETKKEFVDKTGYDINLNSPKQVSDFLYKKLSLPIDDKQLKNFKTKTGYSTSEEALKFFAALHPSAEIILKYRELVKLKTSFIDSLIEKTDADSRVRTNFDQTGTQTGRLSSSSPNLQNIPIKTETGNMIRECFIPEDGYVLLSADYSQIDLRVLAHLSGDENLIKAFKSGEDIHTKTASEVFSMPLSEVDEKKRRIAKTINFGIVYGQTPMGLSRELGIDYQVADAYIKNYFNVYSGVKRWIEKTIEEARNNGYVKNFVGRIRNIPDINSVNKNLRMFSERIAVNMPVQSGSSDIIKKAMLEIYKEIQNKDDIKMILQIHDELLFEVKIERIEYYAPFIKKTMEDVFELEVPLKVDIKKGENWGAMKKIL